MAGLQSSKGVLVSMRVRQSALSRDLLVSVGVFFVLIAIVANAPAALVAPLARRCGAEFYVDQATGTLWKGELKGVRAKGVMIGDVAFTTHPAALLRGRLSLDLVSRRGALDGRASASFLANGEFRLSDARLVFDLAAADEYLILGEPMTGKVRAEVSELTFSPRGCVHADARLWTDVLAEPARRHDGEALDLSGGGACAGKDLVVALSGRSGDGAVRLTLRVTPRLSYTLLAEAAPARLEIADTLQLLGFQRSEGEMSMATSGIIRTVGS